VSPEAPAVRSRARRGRGAAPAQLRGVRRQRKIAENMAVYVRRRASAATRWTTCCCPGRPAWARRRWRTAGARDGDRGARDVRAGAGAQGRPGRAADSRWGAATCCSSTRSTACSR
jgi:hypothetical protein